MSGSKATRRCLSVNDKMEVLKFIDENPGKSQSCVAREFSLAQPTVSSILKNLDVFYDACKSKKLKTITYDMMIMKGKDIVDGLISASLVNASDLPATDFVWKSHIQRFLKRGISSRKTHGESGDANDAGAQHFLESVWPDCFSNIDNDSSRVYNMDKIGLFWRVLPSRTLARVNEHVQGSKTQKDRLTFATTICMDGSVLPLHAIGTSRMPHAVAAAHTTPAAILNGRWMHNRKA